MLQSLYGSMRERLQIKFFGTNPGETRAQSLRLERSRAGSDQPLPTTGLSARSQRVHCWVAWMAIFGLAGASSRRRVWEVGGCKGCRTLGTCQCNREQCNARNLFLLHCTCVALGFRRVGLAGVEQVVGAAGLGSEFFVAMRCPRAE